MKKDPFIRSAIDESLCSVRFNAQDERSVLRRVRAQHEEEKAPVRAKKRGFRLDFAFALGMVLVLVIPLTVFTLRAGSLRTQRVVPLSNSDDPILSSDAPNESLASAQPTAQASAAPILGSTIDESAAIRAARDCYNAVCDTSIFSFEEFTVTCTLDASLYPTEMEGNTQYTVVMESIYGNGCTFEVYVDALNGSVLHSDPKYATLPSFSALQSEKAQAWYKKNGNCILTWQPAAQAEFSRRYEGATLRDAKDGEISFTQASEIAKKAAASYDTAFCYPLLFSERAAADRTARYRVFCFADEVTGDTPSSQPAAVVVLNAATGAVESVRAFDSESDNALMKGWVDAI